MLAHTQPPAISQLLLRSSCPLLALAASGPCKLALCICLSLPSFWRGSLPWDLNSLKDLRRDVDFQFVLLFSYCEDENDEF